MSQHPPFRPAATVVCNLTTRHNLATRAPHHPRAGLHFVLGPVASPLLAWPPWSVPSVPTLPATNLYHTRDSVLAGFRFLSCPVTVRPSSSSSQTRLPSCPDFLSGDASDHCEAYPFKVFCSVFSTRLNPSPLSFPSPFVPTILDLVLSGPPPSSLCFPPPPAPPSAPPPPNDPADCHHRHPSLAARRHSPTDAVCTNTTLRLDSFRYSRTCAENRPPSPLGNRFVSAPPYPWSIRIYRSYAVHQDPSYPLRTPYP